MSKHTLAALLLTGSFVAIPILGCDSAPGDKVVNKSEKTTTDPNGNQSKTETQTVQHPDGSTTTEKHVDNQHTNP